MKDGKRLVITIGRQFGSGGCEVGTKLAQELGLDFYDKNILRMNSDESGIKESYYYMADEKAGNKLLYKIIKSLTPEKGAPSFGSDLTSADNLFRFQSEVIRKLAAEEDCIIMGRCADYVLEGMEGLVRVFIYADMDFREKRTIEKEYYAAKDAKKKQKVVVVKEVKLRTRIDDHDLETKVNAIKKFLEKDNKVKVTLVQFGREKSYQDMGIELLDQVAGQLEDVAEVEKRYKESQKYLMLSAKK